MSAINSISKVNIGKIPNLNNWIQYHGILMSPDDPRLPENSKGGSGMSLKSQVLLGQELRRLGRSVRQGDTFPKKASSGSSDDMKTYALAALTFGFIVFVGKSIKGSAKAKKVTL